MTRVRHFQEELDRLKATLLEMANLAEQSVQLAIDALESRDADKAAAVVEADNDIDALELRIDEMVTQLLALQAPVAGDLRLIIMGLKISNDLERVGDHAVNIANAVRYLVESPPGRTMPEIEEMVRLATTMLNDSLDSFVRRDSALARDIRERDDRVDELHENVFRILLTHMMEDPRRIGPGMDMLLVSRNLERIADLATNIAEDVVFMVEGRQIKHSD
ncbi:MAG TPA: phosphate signaling complex protein PhoU [Longimicrobiales bacterium]|nr:phosphate signaling complex protein PhoU [Longimicrobiales bacterium]